MLNIGLWKDTKDGLAVGGIVDVGAGKECIDQVLHLLIGKDLSVGDGRCPGQREMESGQWRVDS